MTNEPRELLLDTHAWIWLVRGEDRITAPVLEAIFEAAGARTLYVSVMSIWEVSLLARKGRLILNRPCLEWVHAALSRSGTEVVSLTSEIAVECNGLPGRFHDDSADRAIAATPRLEGLTVVTRDRQIPRVCGSGLRQRAALLSLRVSGVESSLASLAWLR